jgi:predicted ATPase
VKKCQALSPHLCCHFYFTIGAILGKSFTLKEVTAVLKENHDMKVEELEKEAISSLDIAINEGILRIDENPENEENDEDTAQNVSYSFYHSIWQSTILSLM